MTVPPSVEGKASPGLPCVLKVIDFIDARGHAHLDFLERVTISCLKGLTAGWTMAGYTYLNWERPRPHRPSDFIRNLGAKRRHATALRDAILGEETDGDRTVVVLDFRAIPRLDT